ncbi:MAG: hypothetical protein OEO23_03935, partial [Gemmatimonadota bacterium]|nr:hypothetical protein [Gemmatimonadota bacterium]
MFGAPGLVLGREDSEILTLQPKRVAVLTYLMVARPGSLHRRDTLLAMFWPEHDADRGRNALSKVLHHLRRSLPPGAILTSGDQIGVDRSQLWCDVTEFERALEGGRLEEGLALYRGDLLQGFHISGSPDFDHWSDLQRSRLRRMAASAAWEIASDAQLDGNGARATRFARQALEWAPSDEAGLRRFLTLLQRYGNRAEAMEAYESFARDLRRDHGVDPSSPTVQLVEAIRGGSLPDDLAVPLQGRSAAGPAATPIQKPGSVPTKEPPNSARPPSRTSIRTSHPPRTRSRLRAWPVT